MELVGGGSDINRATPSSFSVSVLLLASVKRFGVSRMWDFFLLLLFQNTYNTYLVLTFESRPSVLRTKGFFTLTQFSNFVLRLELTI